MPTVDFTMDELLEATDRQTRQIMRETVPQIVRENVRETVREVLRDEFKPLFDEAFEPYAMAIKQDLNRIDERLNRLEYKTKIVKR